MKQHLLAYLRTWHIIRLIRLVVGIAIIVQGLATADKFFIIAGVFFTLMPILNAGCCAAGASCPTERNSCNSKNAQL